MSTEIKTDIISNGSKWAGEAPDSIEKLFSVLEEATLEPCWEDERTKSFICPLVWVYPKLAKHSDKGFYEISGNFIELSHTFQINTNDKKLVARFKKAINKNMATAKYIDSREEYLKDERTKVEWFARSQDARRKLKG